MTSTPAATPAAISASTLLSTSTASATLFGALDDLQQCSSLGALRSALMALCSRHGHLQRLDVVNAAQAGRRQALCLLRMQTEAEEHSLMQALGIGRFGGELVLVVNLASASAGEAEGLAGGLAGASGPRERPH